MSCELKYVHGKKVFYIDKKLTPPVVYALSDFPGAYANTHYAYTNIKQFGEKGINIVSADAAISIGWHKHYPFDSEPVTAEIEAVLDANPNAKVLLRLHMNPPYWWLRDNPDECTVYRTPDGDINGIDDGEQDRLIKNDLKLNMRASLASTKWLDEANEKLIHILESIKGTRIENALIGIQVACGVYGEWHQWGCDVSAPMARRFARFLKEKYQTSASLRKAWNNAQVDFENAEFHPEPFYPTDDGAFRDPQKSQHVIDAQMCIQKTTTEAICHFAGTIKKTYPTLLCGAFYGYYFNTSATGVTGGHLNVEDIYNSGVIDYLCGPFCYMDNRMPNGAPMQRSLLESHRLNNILWLTEMDQFPIGIEFHPGGTEEHFTKNVSILRKNTLQPIFAGQGFWYYDHRTVPSIASDRILGNVDSITSSIYRKRGWWDSTKMMAEIEKIQNFCVEFTSKPYKNDADVLLVCDAKARYYRHKTKTNADEYALLDGIARSGTAYDCIYLSDFEHCEVDRYKCIIFSHCPMISPELRELIKNKTVGKTCIFLNAAGYSDGRTLSIDHIVALSGFSLKRTSAKTVKIKNCEDTISLSEEDLPAFAIEPTEGVSPLAYYENGEIAAAKRENAIYISLPYLPANMAKTLIRESGAHIWTENGSPILAASGYVAINCHGADTQQIKLKNKKTITFITNDFETAVFDTETQERVL